MFYAFTVQPGFTTDPDVTIDDGNATITWQIVNPQSLDRLIIDACIRNSPVTCIQTVISDPSTSNVMIEVPGDSAKDTYDMKFSMYDREDLVYSMTIVTPKGDSFLLVSY